MRDSKGRFTKGHLTNLGKPMSKGRYEKCSKNFFSVENTIRNTGRTRFKKGDTPWINGKKHSKESRLKMSISQKKRRNESLLYKEKKLSLSYRYRIIKECTHCGLEFELPFHRPEGLFCCKSCSDKSMKGRKQKKEWIDKQRMQISGEKCWLWKGGISKEPYGQQFSNKLKQRIRERDNHTCQQCGYQEEELGYKLCVHHIDYNKQNNGESNLISLCRTCHSQTNYSRGDWTDYFKKKLGEANA